MHVHHRINTTLAYANEIHASSGWRSKSYSVVYHNIIHYGVPKYYLHRGNMGNSGNYRWYAIRVTYNREIKVKQRLDAKHIENFLPMKYRVVMRGERRIKELVPAIHNLIFVYLTTEGMKEFKQTTDLPIRYIMDKETNTPLTIPERQMKSFIAVAGTRDEQLMYLDSCPADISKGDKVRVTGGIFEGAEGYFLRIKGDRRVVVNIKGVAAVATAFIHPSLIEKIYDEQQ